MNRKILLFLSALLLLLFSSCKEKKENVVNNENVLVEDDDSTPPVEFTVVVPVFTKENFPYPEMIAVIKTPVSFSGTKAATDENAYSIIQKGKEISFLPYEIGKYEVTQELYKAVMGKNPSYTLDDNEDGQKVQLGAPVNTVSWQNVAEFCNRLTMLTMRKEDCVYYIDENFSIVYEGCTDKERCGEYDCEEYIYFDKSKNGYRLPTEFEWEFAARGGNPNAKEFWFDYAGSDNADDVAWWAKKSYKDVMHRVGEKAPNSLGVYDMSGNVWEWCYDSYGDLKIYDFGDGRMEGPDCCAIRGGGGSPNWWEEEQAPAYCSVMSRSVPRAHAGSDLGFRLARNIEK